MSSSTSALARAFTKRAKRPEINTAPVPPLRDGSVKFAAGTIRRGQISAPVELISTTNVLAFTAPNIRSASSSSSSTSGSENDWDISRTFLSTPNTSPETSSVENSPILPEPKDVNPFFQLPTRSATTTGALHKSSTSHDFDAPAIPERALSHTKKSHQALARNRSRSRMTPPPNSLNNSQNARSSVDIFRGETDASHPFGKELAQVNELAEDYGAESVLEEEERLLMSKGLRKFGVEDYLSEIEELYGGVFEDSMLPPMGPAWI